MIRTNIKTLPIDDGMSYGVKIQRDTERKREFKVPMLIMNYPINIVFLSMEKTVSIRSLKEDQNDYTYWITKTPAERLAAIETLRQLYFILSKDAPERLQRVFRIVDKTSC